MRGVRAMKILKIENSNGFFLVAEDNTWKAIDEIDKDGLMSLLDLFLEDDVEMDVVEEDNLSNQAHLIIYKSIFEKLSSLKESKSKFKDESEREYLSAIQEYSES
jgi:hypothetical protein